MPACGRSPPTINVERPQSSKNASSPKLRKVPTSPLFRSARRSRSGSARGVALEKVRRNQKSKGHIFLLAKFWATLHVLPQSTPHSDASPTLPTHRFENALCVSGSWLCLPLLTSHPPRFSVGVSRPSLLVNLLLAISQKQKKLTSKSSHNLRTCRNSSACLRSSRRNASPPASSGWCSCATHRPHPRVRYIHGSTLYLARKRNRVEPK